MAMTRPSSAATTLGCGRSLDEVWASVDAPLDRHERTCPYCQEARAILRELSAVTKEVTAADIANPALQVSVDTMAHIMTIARTEVRRGRVIPLQQPPRDSEGNPTGTTDLTISEVALATVVRQTSDRLDGAQVRRVHIYPAPTLHPADAIDPVTSPAGHPAADSASAADADADAGARGDRVPPANIAVTMSISVTRDAAIPTLCAQLRGLVAAEVAARVGVHVSTLDIHVEDLHDEDLNDA